MLITCILKDDLTVELMKKQGTGQETSRLYVLYELNISILTHYVLKLRFSKDFQSSPQNTVDPA